jgi:UDP-N-acetylmuramoylalanine--D-glutamate ligase
MVFTLCKNQSEFAGCKIAVLGIARTGLAIAPVLQNLGAKVRISDSASITQLGDRLDQVESLGIEAMPNASPEQAINGMDMVIPSPGIPVGSETLQLAIKRGIPIYSEIEIAYRISRAPIIAVTGTNGKTTTTMLLGEMLRADNRRTFVAGNVSADEVKLPLISAASRAEPEDVIVAEISSFQLEWVEKFRPAIGILTNITPDHMNRHASFEEYVSCKSRLFAAQREDDVAILNAINGPSRLLSHRMPGTLLWFDRGNCMEPNSATLLNGKIVVNWKGQQFSICGKDELLMPGAHNLENVLAAAGAAIAFGSSPQAIRHAATTFQGVVHRMERVDEIDNVLYINNSMCTNVDAAVRSLEAMDRPVVVLAGGVNKNNDFTPLGAMIGRKARHLILFGRDAQEIALAATENGFHDITFAQSLDEAVTIARKIAQPGDAVMLSPACASFDMFSDFEERGMVFRRAVKSLIHDKQG